MLQWTDINFKLNTQKQSLVSKMFYKAFNISDENFLKQDLQLLKNNSGFIKSGEMVAIIGPSGSGKTSLLNILARRYTKHNMPEFSMNGSVKLNH